MEDYLKDIQQEVDLMNKSFNEGLSDSTDAPSTDAPSTNAPTTETPSTESPTTESPTTDSPTTEAPGDLEDEKDRTIAELRAKLAEKELPSTKKPSTSAPTTEAPLQLDEQDFVGDADVEDIVNDKGELNKLLNKIYQKAVSDTRKVLGEGVLRSIPDIVKTNVSTLSSLQKASEQFYQDNEDLKPFKKVVATVFEELSSQNPDKSYSDILSKTGEEVRKRLELQRKATKPPGNGPAPRLPRKKGKPGKSNEKPSIDPIQAEIDEMNKSI